MFKALTLLLLIGQSPNLWTHSGLGLFKLVIVVYFDFLFSFFYQFSIFPRYHYVGGKRCIEGRKLTKAVPRTIVPSSPLDSCLVETNASCTRLSAFRVICVRTKGVY